MKVVWYFLFTVFAGVLSDAIAVTDSREISTGEWEAFGGSPYGCDGIIQAIAVADSGMVYLGGDFQSCENVPASYLVAFDPVNRTFSALPGVNGQGLDGPVRALAVSGDDLYAGGDFDHADGLPVGKIARFDGSVWRALGSGISDPYLDDYWVNTIAVSGDSVYAGGKFHAAGGVDAKKIARFEGGEWHTLGIGIGTTSDWSEVFALLVNGDELLVGGNFTFAGGIESRCIARWDGNNWHAFDSRLVPPGDSCDVDSLVSWDDDIFVGGRFRLESGSTRENIARWDGSRWNSMGPEFRPGTDGRVEALAPAGGNLYVAGNFGTAGNRNASNIARWDGANWHPMETESGEGMDLPVFTLASADGLLYVGGTFTRAAGMPANRVASWDDAEWLPIGLGNGLGIDGQVNAVVRIGSNLYAGGQFHLAGGVVAHNVARWDGSQWHALGSDENNGVQGGFSGVIDQSARVNALATRNGDLYVAGVFRRAGGMDVNHIARWDGSAWHALESGVGYPGQYAHVHALTVWGDDLYVGGEFSRVSGVETWYIARWDGSAWSSLGSDSLGIGVRAMIVHGGDLYVTGRSSGNSLNSIARWDGANWHALGEGLRKNGIGIYSRADGYSMEAFGGDLYVGGNFDLAGGLEADRVARWDGSSWHALNADFSSESEVDVVWALSAVGDHLYVGGAFEAAGGKAVGGITAWDGSEWHSLAGGEPGADGWVRALWASKRKDCFGAVWEEVMVGGSFSLVGGDVSRSIARYSLAGEPNPERIFCSRFEN